jgi:hypothetical protein
VSVEAISWAFYLAAVSADRRANRQARLHPKYGAVQVTGLFSLIACVS